MKIFLDDERFPALQLGEAMLVRNYDEFVWSIKFAHQSNYTIDYISFDHDLGEEMTGLDCVKALVSYDLDFDILTKDFKFYVHSQNPVGKKNIEGYLNGYLSLKFPAPYPF